MTAAEQVAPQQAPPSPDLVEAMALYAVIMQSARLRRESVDALAIRGVLDTAKGTMPPDKLLEHLAVQLNFPKPEWFRTPDPGRLPLVVISPSREFGIITARNADDAWVVQWWQSEGNTFSETVHETLDGAHRFVRLRLTAPFDIGASPSFQLVLSEVLSQKRALLDIAAGTLAVNLLAFAASFYSMQVYDRVVPTQASSTLLVLTLGVIAATLLELLGKWVRSGLMSRLTDAIDQRLARSVYSRFLSLRLDQLPPSVGSTSSRIRGYESVRSFLVGMTTHVMIDAPLGLLALIVLATLGGALAVIPAIFLVIGISIGVMFRKQLEHWAKAAMPSTHLKTGLLVESIEGAEIIKSGQGGWRMLSRWLDITDEARHFEMRMRNFSEHSQYIVAMFQQVAYTLLLAFGALQVGSGSLSMGGLIACSILSGRILNPIAMLPQQIMQWSNTKVTLTDLDRLWKLQSDHPEGAQPVVLESVRWQYELTDVKFSYEGQVALNVPKLQIKPGERIVVLGAVGSGKTTLLRLLSGMYKPQSGRVMLDGIDIDLISKSSLAPRMGYMPQDGRLFAGTLRDNLVLGLTDPGDEVIMATSAKTGLLDTVITPHPKGLVRDIQEGGIGLSGGQRQVLHFTRAMLRKPSIWLLDEPTASMDQGLEARVFQALKNELDANPAATLVLVTHKPSMLALADRVMVFANQQIVMDGPRDAVMQALNEMQQKQRPVPPGAQPGSR